MSTPAFSSDAEPPSMIELADRVGDAWSVIETAIRSLARVKQVWKFSKISGWHLTFDVGSKRLFYFFPQNGGYTIKIVYNDKGFAALRESGLADEKLMKARKYPEGMLLEFQANELNADLLADLLRIKAGSIR